MIEGTRCTCGAGHETFGACIRAKNLQWPDQQAREANRANDAELDAYADARRNGLHPESTRWPAINDAWRRADANL